MGHTEECDKQRCRGECIRLADLEAEGKGECQECEEEFDLEENPDECPHCGELHGYGGEPDYREDFHSDG